MMIHPRITYQFECLATEIGVRSFLLGLHEVLVARAVEEDLKSSIEIAVAEGLNNIVEHALPGQSEDVIVVEISINAAQVFVQLEDSGAAMPGWQLPAGRMADVTVPRAQLPEGGFGWGMIHALTDCLDYSRINGVNRLKMWFGTHPSTVLRRLS